MTIEVTLAAEFLPSWSRTNQALAYFLVGGVPLYLRALDPRASVETNIEEHLLTEYSPLFREPEFLLREELREVENYYAVLVAIAAGQRGVPGRRIDGSRRVQVGVRPLLQRGPRRVARQDRALP